MSAYSPLGGKFPAAVALDPSLFNSAEVNAESLEKARLEAWTGICKHSLTLLGEEVEENWFRDAHPEAEAAWRRLQKFFTRSAVHIPGLDGPVGVTSPEDLTELMVRPALSDAIDAIEDRARRRCLDPEVEDLLSLLAFLRRHCYHWVVITAS